MVSNFTAGIRTLLTPCFLMLVGSSCALGQNAAANSPNPTAKQRMQQELSGIIHQAATEATIKTRDGTMVTTTPLVSSEDLEKVRRFGNEAIPFLSGYVKESKNSLEQQVAVRLIGSIESDRALDELGALAEEAKSPFVRSLTLAWLAPSRREKDALVLERVSTSDPDPRVRAEATRLLQRKLKN